MNRGPRRPDLLGPGALLLAGLALLAVAWFGASGQETVGPQIPFVNLGVGGVILAGTANAVYLMGMRRALRERRAEIASHRRLAGRVEMP
ncbi:MAG: hypothetical protein M3527_08135 [Actinomycetota bacterium]|nr:hypothetical protein [Actinomycetota bacterium]